MLGELASQGRRTIFVDWEFTKEAHQRRLNRLFPKGERDFPQILYQKCERPLIREVDGLRRIVRDNRVEYAVLDSIAYAVEGPPESAEAAMGYFRCVQQLGIGTLSLAHINRSETGDKKPFGSAFFHNSARSTWFMSSGDGAQNPKYVTLYHRKANIGTLLPPVTYRIDFGKGTTDFTQIDGVPEPETAVTLSRNIARLISAEHMTVTAVAEATGKDHEVVRATVNRGIKSGIFRWIGDGRDRLVGLAEERNTGA